MHTIDVEVGMYTQCYDYVGKFSHSKQEHTMLERGEKPTNHKVRFDVQVIQVKLE